MEQELLRIFNENREPMGTAPREEIHKKGYWHETFHCWFAKEEKGKIFLYFQLRSANKKDYPDMLDITAAGHLLADESVRDGIREIEEEIGVKLMFSELKLLDIIDYSVTSGELRDNEIAHVFLYPFHGTSSDFVLQKEEVSGIYRTELTAFKELIEGVRKDIVIVGFEEDSNDNRCVKQMTAGMKRFVPHEDSYYKRVLALIEQKMAGGL
ncbi:NUDIX hydrolase [Metabacillus indicus]|uniref:NUDIX hydrolase n=1 Tax=Metabacillus indicus TaxID=246786 RepID=UPI003CFB6913